MVIAVTGGIGCGKSAVSRILADTLGASLQNSDEICRQELSLGRQGLVEVERRWGRRFLAPSGELDRAALREAAFHQPTVLVDLENILHPLVARRLQEKMAVEKERGRSLVAEVPLLFEVGWEKMFDCIVVVRADKEQMLDRVARRDGRSREEVLHISAAQMPLCEKIKRANYCIDNSGIFSITVAQIYYLARCLQRSGY